MSLALVIFLVVVVGSTLQRVSGMGLGLIGGPILMLIMGPVEGILVINVLACINAVLTTYSVRENVSWKKFGLIAPVMVIGSLAAALLIRRMDTAGLMVVVGLALGRADGSDLWQEVCPGNGRQRPSYFRGHPRRLYQYLGRCGRPSYYRLRASGKVASASVRSYAATHFCRRRILFCHDKDAYGGGTL